MLNKLFMLALFFYSMAFAQLVGPKISIQQNEFDFGNIEQGKTVTHNFVITNNGGDILKISDVRASCGCTAAKPEKNELAPGESANIKVEFNSTGRMGTQQKYVYVKTNDVSNPELKLKITGNILTTGSNLNEKMQPKIYFTETQHDFGVVKEGKVVDYEFKFSNKGKSTLEIKDIKTSCGCTAALVSEKKLMPGQVGTLKVELDTKNRTGKMSRSITITSNDPKEPDKILTIYAEVNKGSN